MDYSSFGFNQYGFNFNSLGAQLRQQVSALYQNLFVERSPYLNPISVSLGTLVTTGGGVTELQSAVGGTTLLTADPITGSVTISGGIVIGQTLNVGTMNDSLLAGSTQNTGTFTIGVGTAGTLYSSVFSGGSVSAAITTGGTILNTIVSGGTILSPNYSGTPIYVIRAGSAALSYAGNLDIQTYGTSVCIAVNKGGTTFIFLPAGTV